MGLSARKRGLFWLIYGLVLLALVEGMSALAVRFVLPYFKPYYYEAYFNEQAEAFGEPDLAAYARDRFDPDLGWDNRPNRRLVYSNFLGRTIRVRTDALGARGPAQDGGPHLIDAYGDSYTFGSDVNDDETWSHALSQLAGMRVRNFGVVAFGPDQALLKIERNVRRGIRAPIIVLAMISENINRLVNVYRPFYARKEPGPTFKPIFVESNGAMRPLNLVPQPLRSQADYQAAIDRAKPYDYWYGEHARWALAQRFPYAWQALRIAGREIDKPAEGGLWGDPQALGRLRYVLERFRAHGEAKGYLPILVLIPQDGRELATGRFHGDTGAIQQIEREFAGRLAVIDLLSAAAGRDIDLDRYNLAPNFGHLSPYGNELVARLLQGALRPFIERVRGGAAGTSPQG